MDFDQDIFLLVGIHLILSGSAHCLLCRQQIEKVSDRIHVCPYRPSTDSAHFRSKQPEVEPPYRTGALRRGESCFYYCDGDGDHECDRDRHELPASFGT